MNLENTIFLLKNRKGLDDAYALYIFQIAKDKQNAQLLQDLFDPYYL